MNVYETKTMAERLNGNTYPGRGIDLGCGWLYQSIDRLYSGEEHRE